MSERGTRGTRGKTAEGGVRVGRGVTAGIGVRRGVAAVGFAVKHLGSVIFVNK